VAHILAFEAATKRQKNALQLRTGESASHGADKLKR